MQNENIQTKNDEIYLSVQDLTSLVSCMVTIVGSKWFDRKLKKDKADREAAQGKDSRRQRFQYTPSHPLFQWYFEFSQWIKLPVNSGAVTPQSVLLLASFCSNLEKAKKCENFDKMVEKLRKENLFYSVAFEIEVAVYYVNGGHVIEFYEVSSLEGERSPDLKVTDTDGKVLWVECKLRNHLNGREEDVSRAWNALQENFCRIWLSEKINIKLTITSKLDINQSDIIPLSSRILTHVAEWASRNFYPKFEKIIFDDKFEFSLKFLAAPDEVLRFSDVNEPLSDWSSIQGDVMNICNGEPEFFRNPLILELININFIDKYSGILNSFNSASNQIPESGPGVIWIRTVYPTNDSRGEGDLIKVARKIERELSGSQKTRVNGVFLSYRFFSLESNGGIEEHTYCHNSSYIAHKNPKVQI